MALLLNFRLWVALALAGMLAFTHLTAYRSGRHAVQAKWDAANVKQEQAAQEQANRNRELQRAAELKYTVAAQTRDRFFVTTVKEIAHDAAPLAACPIPESVRLRINAATECAGSDSPSTSCTAVPVPSP